MNNVQLAQQSKYLRLVLKEEVTRLANYTDTDLEEVTSVICELCNITYASAKDLTNITFKGIMQHFEFYDDIANTLRQYNGLIARDTYSPLPTL